MFRTLAVYAFLLAPIFLSAQMQTYEKPALLYNKRSDFSIPQITLPKVNNDSLLSIHTNTGDKIFAHLFITEIDIKKDSRIIRKDNRNYYYISVHSEGAYSLNFTLTQCYLPKGGKLFVIDKQGNSIGAFTHINNKDSGTLPIAPMLGDKITIEYSEPTNAGTGNLVITRVGHDFKGILKNNLKSESSSCNVDINCTEGNNWQKEKQSVCKLIINNTEHCTGALVNNTAKDKTPYLLTANHCIDSEYLAQNTIFYFNYEATKCGEKTAEVNQSIAGATLIATPKNDSIDFALIKLSQIPPREYNPYYAGWDASGKSDAYNVAIHHPRGDVKKISIDEDRVVTTDYGKLFEKYTHWLVQDWEIGTTEGGSSGGPLFNKDKRIIGILSGGDANCTTPVNDYYQKISAAYKMYPAIDESLIHWLNPVGSNLPYMDGLNPYIYEGSPITNLQFGDTLATYHFDRTYYGVWTGKNTVSSTAIAEKFEGVSNKKIYGVKFYCDSNLDQISGIDLKIWNINKQPGDELFSVELTENNYFDNNYFAVFFDQAIETDGNFFVGLEFDPLKDVSEKFSVLSAKHRNTSNETAWTKINNQWLPFSEAGFNTALSFEVYVGNDSEPVSYSNFSGLLQNKNSIDKKYYQRWSKELFESDTIQIYNEKDSIYTALMENGENWISANNFFDEIGAKFETKEYSHISAVKIGVVENNSNDSVTINIANNANTMALAKMRFAASKIKPRYFNWLTFNKPIAISDSFLVSIQMPSKEYENMFSIGIYDDNQTNSFAKIEDKWIAIENFGFNSQIALGIELCHSEYFQGSTYQLSNYPISISPKKIYKEAIHLTNNFVDQTLHIDFGNNIISDIDVRIISLTGATVQKAKYSTINGKQLDINVSPLDAGMYIINLTFKDKYQSFKFVKY